MNQMYPTNNTIWTLCDKFSVNATSVAVPVPLYTTNGTFIVSAFTPHVCINEMHTHTMEYIIEVNNLTTYLDVNTQLLDGGNTTFAWIWGASFELTPI
jgi:GTP:adenosylcobinamide-phosphate guanylyltransferase